MSIASSQFLALVLAGLLAYHLPVRAAWWRRGVLGLLSAAFMLSHLPAEASPATLATALAPLPLFALAGYLGLGLVRRKTGLPLVLAALGMAYLWLRRFDFATALIPLPTAAVTVGLSYILFRIFQVLIDYAQGEIRTKPTVAGYMLHIFAFYTLASGPIWRHQDHVRQLEGIASRSLDATQTYLGLNRMLTGLIKSLLFVPVLDRHFQANSTLLATAQPLASLLADGQTGLLLALCATLYLMSLYFNFSGYMDIVNGAARLFLLNPPENFANPFQSKNFSDIWSRWHITLSDFFKLYMFNPLIKFSARMLPALSVNAHGVLAFFLTFFVLGLWHGTTERFCYYGLALGLCVSGNKLWDILLKRVLGKVAKKALQAHGAYRAIAGALGLSAFAACLATWWLDAGRLPTLAPRGAGIAAFALAGLCLLFYGIRLGDTLVGRTAAWWSAKLAAHSPYGMCGAAQLVLLLKFLLVLGLLFTSGHTAPQFVYQNF